MKTFKFYTLGCKVNRYDSAELANELMAFGWQAVESGADVAIINSCSVTQAAINKNKRMMAKAKAENPLAKLVVVGCWPRAYGQTASDLGVDLVLPGQTAAVNAGAMQKLWVKETDPLSGCLANLKPIDRARYFLKIQDGCQQFCSYCIIPYVRGELTSQAPEKVLNEATTAARAGYQEIVLSGIHLGLYGLDLSDSKQINLVSLLKDLVNIPDLKRIRLSSIEITEVTDELIALLAREEKICPHLHIPLQSGCDKILKLMNRPYTSGYFTNRLRALRVAMPDIAITTDVIVGFPCETGEDFALTFDFIKNSAFSRLHVFAFSAHERVPAAKFSGQVDREMIKERSHQLRALSQFLEGEYRKKFLGQEVSGIVIGQKHGQWLVKTDYYFDCFLQPGQLLSGELKIGRLVKISC